MNIFAELERGVLAKTAEDTQAVAERLARDLPEDRVVALSGDLGAGKTTFVKGLAVAWGVREAVTSPSFAVCNLHRGTRLLVHVDAYRLTGPESWDDLMVDDFLVTPWCLVVEWPERIQSLLPRDTLWLSFAMNADESRTISTRQAAVQAPAPD